MKILGQLESACIEVLSSDPTGPTVGRIWWNTTSGQIKFDDGSGIKALLRNDLKVIIGNSGAAANNVRMNRAAAGVMQLVLGDDVTAEGSLSTALAQLSSRLENYLDAGKPAFGNPGRLIYTTDNNELQIDSGSGWVTVGSGVDSGSNVGGFTGIFKDRSVNTLRFKSLQSSDGSITLTANTDDVDLAGPRTHSQVFGLPTASFAVRVATTTSGTLASSFHNGSSIDGVTLATNDIILIKNQASSGEDGVYVVQSAGAPTRHSSYNTVGNVNNAMVTVTEGRQNNGTSWYQNLTLVLMGDSQSWSRTANAQSFTVPANVTVIQAEFCGGGGAGGGGGANSSGNTGSGGAGGNSATAFKQMLLVTPAETLSIQPGAGGLGGLGGGSSNGGPLTAGVAGTAGASTIITGSFGTITAKGAPGGGGSPGNTASVPATITYLEQIQGAAGGAGGSNGADADDLSLTNGGAGGLALTGKGGGGGGAPNYYADGGDGGNANSTANVVPSGSDGSLGSGGGGGGGSGASTSGSMFGGRGGFGGNGFVKLTWVG